MVLPSRIKSNSTTATPSARVLPARSGNTFTPLNKPAPKATPKTTTKTITKPVTKANEPLVSKAKAAGSKAFDFLADVGKSEYGVITKVAKAPIIGQTLNIVKDTTVQTAKDLGNVFAAPFKSVPALVKAELDPKASKELKALRSEYWKNQNDKKLSVSEKAKRRDENNKKINKILQKFGSQTDEQTKSAERGAEIGMGFSAAGGNVSLGAVEGNVKFILNQATGNKLIEAGSAFKKLVGKGKPPQEIFNTVMRNGLEKTPTGKRLIKTALEAKQQGKNVDITLPEAATAKKPSGLVEQYLKKNGNVVDSDRAKELLPGYTPDKAPEFHKQSQAVRDEVYAKLLKDNKGKANNTVHFTAGGAASGKSESIGTSSARDSIAYDTTLSSPARVADVKKALESGYNINVEYTAADPIAAWERAQIRGRKIPPESFARDYEQSLENVKKLYQEYKDSPNATFRFVDNRGAQGEAKLTTFDEVNQMSYNKNRILDEIQNSQKQTRIGSTSGQTRESIPGQPKPGNEAKISPKEVSVPREQLPVTSKGGLEKASKLEARVTEALNKTPQEVKNQLGSTYTQMNKKENIAAAVKFTTDNPEEAMAILRGEKEAPKNLLKNSIYVAMENQARGDVDLARKLASLQSTRAGQELSILTEIDPHSPVKAIRDVINVREEAFKARFKGKAVGEIKKKVIDDIQKKIKTPDKYDWNKFVDSIQC